MYAMGPDFQFYINTVGQTPYLDNVQTGNFSSIMNAGWHMAEFTGLNLVNANQFVIAHYSTTPGVFEFGVGTVVGAILLYSSDLTTLQREQNFHWFKLNFT